MPCNDSLFFDEKDKKNVKASVKLSAFNLNDTSSGGGLKTSARVVTIPAGSVLLRLFMPKGGSSPVDFGEWWFTPYELNRVASYFGVSLALMTPGRTEGRSALHGALGLLSEWYSSGEDEKGKHKPHGAQLSRFHAVKTKDKTYAMYGEGDVASTTGYGRVIKPIRLQGGRAARQVFLPQPWTYIDNFTKITPAAGAITDVSLASIGARFKGQKLPFE